MDLLCEIRNLSRAIADFENAFQKEFTISLNEGMTLCTLNSAKCLNSGQLAERLGLSYSNMSKVIKHLEDKHFIARCVGKEDKRQMLFSITENGKNLLNNIKNTAVEIPPILQEILEKESSI